jgi:hypothetical protein
MAKLLFGDGRSDKGNCTAGRVESHGYQGLPKGSVRKGYLGNRGRWERNWNEAIAQDQRTPHGAA